MINVRRELCLGCGRCAQNCLTGAIVLRWDHAQIDQSRCTQCRLCMDICLQGAIVEMVTISKDELRATVNPLTEKAGDLIARIESLTAKLRR